MRIESLALKNFRNIESSVFYPDSKINVLTGLNGQGKTSYLEAFGVLSSLKSFRESKPIHWVKWGSSVTEIECRLSQDSGAAPSLGMSSDVPGQPVGDSNPGLKVNLKVGLKVPDVTRSRAFKTAYINNKSYSSSVGYLSQRYGNFELGFHTIIFNPADHDLVRGDPAVRRSYLDRVIAAEDFEYFKKLQQYQKLLVQRNAALKSASPSWKAVLEGFTLPFIQLGAWITQRRLGWLDRAISPLRENLVKVAPTQLDLSLGFLSSWFSGSQNEAIKSNKNNELYAVHFTGHVQLPSLELLERALHKRVKDLAEAERHLGHSLMGPHRDDWVFLLGGQPLKGHGSQGEVRASLLALKLAEIQLFRKNTGHRPVFLLDDFSSELDRERRSYLMKYLLETDLQTFVTTTEDHLQFGKQFHVSSGSIGVI